MDISTLLSQIEIGLNKRNDENENENKNRIAEQHEREHEQRELEDSEPFSLSFINPLPSCHVPFSFYMNEKHSPLIVFTISGTAGKNDINLLCHELKLLLLFNNHNQLKYKLVFDLKKVNFLHLDSLCNIFYTFTLLDPLGGSLLLNYVDKLCFLKPSQSIPEHKEVLAVLNLAFIGFGDLCDKDNRYYNVKTRFVTRNHEVDKFMKE